jgi:predicted  nucleic acid-binding Zn-ribbon protein
MTCKCIECGTVVQSDDRVSKLSLCTDCGPSQVFNKKVFNAKAFRQLDYETAEETRRFALYGNT